MADLTFMSENELPVLYIPWPKCSHCDEDVEIEGSDRAYCRKCLVEWHTVVDGEQSDLLHAGTPACGVVAGVQREPYDFNKRHWDFGPRQPCILSVGHTSGHLCPYSVTVSEEGVS